MPIEHADDCDSHENDEDGYPYVCNCPAAAYYLAVRVREAELRAMLGHAERSVVQEARRVAADENRSRAFLITAVDQLDAAHAAYRKFYDDHWPRSEGGSEE